MTEAEATHLASGNEAYQARFGFPFILAVKGRSKDAIIQSLETRLKNDPQSEFTEALQQIEQIALLRLKDRLPS